MNTTARMKGNRSSAGETLPGAPLEWAPSSHAAVSPTFESPTSVANRRFNWRRRSILVPALALIGLAGLFVALGGDSKAGTSPIPQGEDSSVQMALPGTPTPTPEQTAAAVETEAPTAANTAIGATVVSSAQPATAAPATPAAAVRVRYEILPGDSCDLLRQKFGFPAAVLTDFATALSRISGRTPANQCAFRQGDVVCIPTPADLDQLDQLTRDTGCLLGSTAAGSGS